MKQELTENHGWTSMHGNQYKFVNGDGDNNKESHSGITFHLGMQQLRFFLCSL